MQSKITFAMRVAVLLAMFAEVRMVQSELWINPLFESFATAGMSGNGGFVRLKDGSLMIVEGSATRTSNDNGKTWSGSHPMIFAGQEPGISSPYKFLLK